MPTTHSETEVFRISFSAVQSYRLCQQKYIYQYLRGLKPLVKGAQLTAGDILHKYLETYYRALSDGAQAEAAHTAAKAVTTKRYEDELLELAFALRVAEQHETADALSTMLERSLIRADRYFIRRGIDDAKRYEIIFCEEPTETKVTDGIVNAGKIDLVTRDRVTGLVQVWEHKTVDSFPKGDFHLIDLQTTLYKAIVELDFGLPVDGVIWNYIRRKPATEPELLKNGTLTRRKDLDCDPATYERAIRAHGQDVNDYHDVLQYLAEREIDRYFVRRPLIFRGSEQIILGDMIQSAQDMREFASTWQTSGNDAIRNIGRHCDYCFREGTPVTLVDGSSKPIEAIKIGDQLIGYNGAGELAPTTVTATLPHVIPSLLRVEVDGKQAVYVTDNHRFFIHDRWVYASDLQIGDEITALTQADVTRLRMLAKNPMYDAVTDREVWEFAHNGKSITDIRRVYPGKGKKPVYKPSSECRTGEGFTVYEISCSPHENYFGAGLLSHNCDYSRLCIAKLTGGNEDYVISQHYTIRQRKEETPDGDRDTSSPLD